MGHANAGGAVGREPGMETVNIDLPVAVTLRVQSRSGKVHVIAEPRDDVQAETDHVEHFLDDGGSTLVVRSARGGTKPMTVRCPVDTDIHCGTQSGSVKLEGRFGTVRVTTMSGGIEVDEADEADLRTMSGSLTIRECHGRSRLNAVSGSITAGDVDTMSAGTISGSIKVRKVLGDVRAKTVSGGIELGASGGGTIALKTVSGFMRITLPKGTEPQTIFKTRGNVRCDCPRGNDCRIEAASLSGSIEVLSI
jgi:DUF4097 and DUF4098 domain-containing protein YvlB